MFICVSHAEAGEGGCTPLKGGYKKTLTLSREAGRKKYPTRDFPILYSPVPVFNDQSPKAEHRLIILSSSLSRQTVMQ